jgi:hypothetical protein
MSGETYVGAAFFPVQQVLPAALQLTASSLPEQLLGEPHIRVDGLNKGEVARAACCRVGVAPSRGGASPSCGGVAPSRGGVVEAEGRVVPPGY